MHLYHQGHICITKIIKCIYISKFLTLIRSWSKLGLKKPCCVFTTLSCHSNWNPLFNCMPHPKTKWLTLWSVYKHRALIYTFHCAPLIVLCEWVQDVHNLLRRHSNIPMSQSVRFGYLLIYLGLFPNQSKLWVNWCCGAKSKDEDWPQKLTDIVAVLQASLIQYLKVSQDTESVFDRSLQQCTGAFTQNCSRFTAKKDWNHTFQVFNTRIPFVPILIRTNF